MNQPTAQTSGQVVQDIEDRARAEILALMPETGRDLFKTHDERVADALIKIRAERVEKQAAERAATQYAAARQRGIDSVQPLAAEPQAEAPSAAPVVAENSYKVQGTARRNLLTPAIEAAQRMCENQFDAPAVWAVLVQMAQDGKRPLVGVTEDGIKWNDAEDNPQFLTLKNLRDRLRQKKKKAL